MQLKCRKAAKCIMKSSLFETNNEKLSPISKHLMIMITNLQGAKMRLTNFQSQFMGSCVMHKVGYKEQ